MIIPFSKPKPQKPTLETITDALLAETSPWLERQLETLLAPYDPQRNPLGVREAKQIIFALLQTAAAQRRTLPQRVRQAVEKGTLLDGYRTELKNLDDLTRQAEQAHQWMLYHEQRYLYAKALYHNVLGRTYETEMTPNDQELVPPKKADFWKTIFTKEDDHG